MARSVFCLTFQGSEKNVDGTAATKELLVLLQSVSHINLFLSGYRTHAATTGAVGINLSENTMEILVGK